MNIHVRSQIHPKRQFGLDLIRASAIGLVLLSHFSKTIDYLGFWGVELFFGLSGYLIGHILWRSFSTAENWSAAQIINFWARRWWRTLPSYYLFFSISLLLVYLLQETIPSSATLSKFIWFGQSFTKHHGWFYGISWSLCIEEWFYLIFPILLLLLSRCGLNAKTAFRLSILIIFVSCFVTRYLLIEEGVGADLRLVTVARLDAIASGVFVAYYMENFKPLAKQQFVLFIIGIVLITGSVVIPYVLGMSFEMIKGNSYLLLTAPLGGSFILPFCSAVKRPKGVFTFLSDSIEKISLWSYSIYLCHMCILTVVYALQNRFGMAGFRNNTYGNLLTKTTGLVLILIISSFLYNYFEAPLTRKRPAELRRAQKRAKIYS